MMTEQRLARGRRRHRRQLQRVRGQPDRAAGQMEKGMVVQSGNDAAIALAEHVAGSEQAFAQLMNAYAKKIGMKAIRIS